MKSYTVRDWATVGLFGALWGAVELTLGGVLHAILPPLANTFLTGVVLAGIGAAIALTGNRFVSKRGSVLLIGVVTAILKLSSIDGAKIGPVVAILVESALMEGVLWIARRPRPWAFIAAGALAVGWSLPHKFIMMRVLYGRGANEVYNKMVQEGSQMLGLDTSLALLILAILLLVRLIVGATGGWSAWELGNAVARRIGARGSATSEEDH
jgi:hypothetical protein